jgi:hypothetical protein
MNVEDEYVYGIAYGCPAYRMKDDCPFKKVEHLSFKEKLIWISGLSKDELNLIKAHHEICTKSIR